MGPWALAEGDGVTPELPSLALGMPLSQAGHDTLSELSTLPRVCLFFKAQLAFTDAFRLMALQ